MDRVRMTWKEPDLRASDGERRENTKCKVVTVPSASERLSPQL